MKKIFLATAFAVCSVGAVSAADMPVAYKAAPVAAPRCANFGGWYVGANITVVVLL